jgi:hypothetical protein
MMKKTRSRLRTGLSFYSGAQLFFYSIALLSVNYRNNVGCIQIINSKNFYL